MKHLAIGAMLFAAMFGLSLTPTALAAQQTVELRFAWPADLVAKVGIEKSRVRTGIVARDAVNANSNVQYRMSVERHPEGKVVRADSFSTTSRVAGVFDATQPVAQLEGLWPTYLVSNDGAFKRVLDRQVLRRAMLQFMAADAAGRKLDTAAARMNAAIVTDAMIDGTAAQEWQLMVGAWVGAELEVGETYVVTDTVPVPAMPDLKVVLQMTTRLAKWAPCSTSATSARCVRLEMVSRPEPNSIRQFLADLTRRVGGGAAAAAQMSQFAASLQTQTEITLLTEPKTLVPYRATISRKSVVTDPKTGQSGTDLMKKNYTFTYTNRR